MHISSVGSDSEVLKGPSAFHQLFSDVPVVFLFSWFANFFRQELFYSSRYLSSALGADVLGNYVYASVHRSPDALFFLILSPVFITHLSPLSSSKPCQGSPFPTELNRVLCKPSKTAALQPKTPFCYSPKHLPSYPSEFPSGCAARWPCSELISRGFHPKPPGKFKQRHLIANLSISESRGRGAQASIFETSVLMIQHTTQPRLVAPDFGISPEQTQQPATACSSIGKHDGN